MGHEEMRRNGVKWKMRHGIGAALSLAGFILPLLVIAVCLPLALPRLLGYEVYAITSGSMEPAIPTGSAVYVKPVRAEEVAEGDVIVFYGGHGGEAVTTHRVVENRAKEHEFITRGDANPGEDMEARPYRSLIGKVELSLPKLGKVSLLLSNPYGKVCLASILALSVLLGAMGRALKRAGTERKSDDGKKRIVLAAMVIFALIFLISIGAIGVSLYRYWADRQLYGKAAQQYTDMEEENKEGEEAAGNGGSPKETAPITVNFEELQAVNGDIIGWIYCQGTEINYPVLKGEGNDFYLKHGYDGMPSNAGAIFVEASNRPGFADGNTIIYGHHMKDGSMFAGLDEWKEQEYYENHPVMWLLTPGQNYKVVLFSGYTTSADSDAYTVFTEPGEGMKNYLENCLLRSDFQADVELDENARYVLLSTCSYVFEDARYVVHGMLTE